MNKKGITITAERLVFILLAIVGAIIAFVLVSRMAPHLFDSLKDLI